MRILFYYFAFTFSSFANGLVQLNDFFPFGVFSGDSSLTTKDDSSSPPITLDVAYLLLTIGKINSLSTPMETLHFKRILQITPQFVDRLELICE